MSLYDRDYARAPSRAEPSSARVWLGLHPVLTALLALNVAVFFLWMIFGAEQGRGGWLARHFCAGPEALAHHRWHTLLTYAFSHQDPWHLLFNLLGLWFFGRELERRYGGPRLLFLYVGAGVAAGLAHSGLMWALGSDAAVLGASGATMAILTVFACVYPNELVWFLFFLPMPCKYFVPLLVVLDLLSLFGASSPAGPPVAHAAHLAGVAFGFGYWRGRLRRLDGEGAGGRPLGRRIRGWFRRKPKLVLVPRPARQEPEATEAPQGVDAETATRVDELLVKIRHEGMGALSTSERAYLEAASRKYRQE